MPLVNVLAAGVHDPAGVLEIAEYTGHIESDLFHKKMTNINHIKTFLYCVFFDGASHI
jgi:hypothetical protein